ncbi:ABC transporter substrate-binding protein [Phosphitispora sp. TUW77]|uniref:ABC transporter substrate-binding protein n=1 Tax=Phosphitispora sp. TUW77 TaxID=3152361 RepID=UPI003AB568C5
MVKRLMKKRAILVIALIFSLIVAGCGGAQQSTEKSSSTEAKETYKIGAILDISGPGSSLGVPERDTVQMIIDKVNANGGINGHQIELIMLDNKSNETEAALAAKSLIQKDVLAIIGCTTSGTTLAMLESIQQAKIPLVSAAASIRIVEPINERKWVFKTAQSDSLVAQKIAGYLKSQDITKIAFASMNNAYGDSGKVEFEKVAAQEGIQIVAQEKFEANDTIMTSQLTNIKKADPQAVICWAIPPSASSFTTGFEQMGLTMPLIHSHGIGNQTFIKLAGESADGVIFPAGKLLVAENLPDNDPQKQVLVEYAGEYEEKFGPRNTFGGHAWDALQIVLSALEKAGPDKAKIRDKIEKTTDFTGISGVFNMSTEDHNGLDLDSMVMVKISGDKWEPVN